MPSSIVLPAFQASTKVQKVGPTFTGDVFLDRIYSGDGQNISNVTFTPCARTYWHTHEHGQMIKVLAGSGLVCDKGGQPRRIEAGDVVWAQPGTTHWHGAAEGTIMTHLVVASGQTFWHEEVTEEEFKSGSVSKTQTESGKD
ncbi:hypothetical protein PFICI_04616 [Pestalotiopsis fici W106-1]|uniref:Cupin type-2 domain-containing protein n=1 Tax=Pestalotiopsis fici (strain W106-1 / CGMCC3.15140) TaxID=1229662 RepID=W3X9L7_PESFW|nr:uncharacterized protein PFICI_04616 [Pestalotiopsis fici W106-1]ETS82740.1 hypothetical protein PFICI_04616 [Pestalotiopsis fici W106-1]